MLVPIACRFVPYDQWFITHLDDTSKVKQVKLWILSKCSLVRSPGPHSQRSVSPIVFASTVRSRSSVDSLDDGYNEDDEHSDQDVQPSRPASSKPTTCPHRDPKPGSFSQPQSSPLIDQYNLLSFSTGSILEDEFTLSWYNLRPYELLEMHPVGIVAPLQRDILTEYIQPYFLAKVGVLRAVRNHKSGRFEAPCPVTQRLDSLSTKPNILRSEKKRKTKVDWKARWVIVHRDILFLCKDHVASPPVQQFALNTITALHGADTLERAFSIVTQPRVICIKFRHQSTSPTGVVSPPPSYPTSPTSKESKISAQDSPCLEFISDLQQTTEMEDWGEYSHDQYDACKVEGEWVVLDMPDDHAFSSILRILHRQASHSISSSFVPSSSIIAVSCNSMSSSFTSYDTTPYPEWRINTVENARKAGMGDVGKAMGWVLWTEKGHWKSLLDNIRHHRRAFSRGMQHRTTVPSDIYCGSDDENDDDSEMEWDGWMRDLERQSRVKQQSEKASRSTLSSRQAHIPIGTSLPSPPLSEASAPSSPRVRSPSLSMSQVATCSFGSHPHSQHPNIGSIIQVDGVRTHRSMGHPNPPEKIKSTIVSTVSVGMVPSSRRRSSTLFSEFGATARRRHEKSKQDRELSQSFFVNDVRTNARTISVSACPQYSPSTSVRHAHSSSNLRVSTSPYESDAAIGHPEVSSPLKRQSAFMRNMSLQAGRLVRRLESAIDFVDEKTTT